MLRAVPFKNASRAEEYYTQSLVKEDYYSQKHQTPGIWHGKTATRLGLTGEVTADEFSALARNQHPVTGEKLTLRTREGRLIGMDFNFGAPKSLSLLYALTGNPDIIKVFQQSVTLMMEAVERDAETRVRKNGAQSQRTTGNLVYSLFIHHTSRPVTEPGQEEGTPDPHLHSHAFTQNLTWDFEEECFKACKFRISKQRAPYYEAIGRSYLAHGIRQLGFEVRKVGRSFEIEGIPRSLIHKFARRTQQIDQIIAELGIKNAKAKDLIGAKSRESKSSGMSAEETVAHWKSRLSSEDHETIKKVLANKGKLKAGGPTASTAVDYALEHCFAHHSVVKSRDLFREAIAFGYGHVLPYDITQELRTRPLIKGRIRGTEYCTTENVLNEEQRLIQYGRDGKGTQVRFFNQPYPIKRDFLSEEQQRAVLGILHSRDRILAVHGAPGVGKTTLVQEIVEGVELSGKRVLALAPTASAAYDTLAKKEGFKNARTLESFLQSPTQQQQAKGQLIWLDEAGLVSVPDLLKLCEVLGPQTRILLTGDLGQHAPVSRGAGFRLLLEHSRIHTARVKTIRRQTNELYRAAAQAISDGDTETAFEHLQTMGAFVEITDKRERYHELARQYVSSMDESPSPFLVSPTHAESAQVTSAVRNHLRELKKLGPDQDYQQLINTRWTDAQKTKAELYEEGHVIQFHQNAKGGIVRGARLLVTGRDEEGHVVVQSQNKQSLRLNLDEARKFQVFRQREIKFARGDLLRVTRNGFFESGKRYNNGDTYRIARIYPSGSLKLSNGDLLKKDHGHFTHGYVSTSYSSQSKTTNPVFIAQSSQSLKASSLNQFNVSLTRGRTQVKIFTDDLNTLKEAVQRSEFQLTATEFRERHTRSHQPHQRMPANDNNDPNFAYDVSGKTKEAIFNRQGEFRYSPRYIQKEVGGSFVNYVNFRREKYSGLDPETFHKRAETQKKPSPEAKKEWADHKQKKNTEWSQDLQPKAQPTPQTKAKEATTPNKQASPSEMRREWSATIVKANRNWTSQFPHPEPKEQPSKERDTQLNTPSKAPRNSPSSSAPHKELHAAKEPTVKQSKTRAFLDHLPKFESLKQGAKERFAKLKERVPSKATIQNYFNSPSKNKGKGKAVPPPKKTPPPPKIIIRRGK